MPVANTLEGDADNRLRPAGQRANRSQPHPFRIKFKVFIPNGCGLRLPAPPSRTAGLDDCGNVSYGDNTRNFGKRKARAESDGG